MRETQGHNIKLRLKRLNISEMSFLMSPPENSSDKTTVELELLENIGRRVKEEDIITIKKYENNTVNEYIELLDLFSLNYNLEEIKEISDDIDIIVAEEKKKHGRMRPNILGKKQGFMINESFGLEDDSSYPSLHSTKSMFLSLLLAEEFPLYKDAFMELSTKISNSRLLASKNYPTDNLAGQTLANVLFNKYKEGN